MGSRFSKSANKIKASKAADGNVNVTTTISDTEILAKKTTKDAAAEKTENREEASTSAAILNAVGESTGNLDENANTIAAVAVAVPTNLDENGNIVENESSAVAVTSDFDPDKNPKVVHKRVNKQRQMSTLPPAFPPAPPPQGYPTSTLYVGDLDLTVTDTMLREKFSDFGNIISVFIYRDFFSPQSLGYAYIKFQNASDAKMAKDALNFSLLTGTPMRVLWSGEQYSLNRRATKIRVKKLLVENVTYPWVSTDDIREEFSEFGSFSRYEFFTTAKERNGIPQSHISLEFETNNQELSSRTTPIEQRELIISGRSLIIEHEPIFQDPPGEPTPEEKLLCKDFFRCCLTVIKTTMERANKISEWPNRAFYPICFHLTFEIECGTTNNGIGNPD